MTANPRQPKQQNETFVKAPPWLYRTDPGFSDPEIRTYLALREHHRENGRGKGAIPGEKTVADMIGVSKRTAERAIKGLWAKGAIVVTARPGTSNRYEFPDVLQPPTLVTAVTTPPSPSDDATLVTQVPRPPSSPSDDPTLVTAVTTPPRYLGGERSRGNEAEPLPEGQGAHALQDNARIAPAGGVSQEAGQEQDRRPAMAPPMDGCAVDEFGEEALGPSARASLAEEDQDSATALPDSPAMGRALAPRPDSDRDDGDDGALNATATAATTGTDPLARVIRQWENRPAPTPNRPGPGSHAKPNGDTTPDWIAEVIARDNAMSPEERERYADEQLRKAIERSCGHLGTDAVERTYRQMYNRRHGITTDAQPPPTTVNLASEGTLAVTVMAVIPAPIPSGEAFGTPTVTATPNGGDFHADFPGLKARLIAEHAARTTPPPDREDRP